MKQFSFCQSWKRNYYSALKFFLSLSRMQCSASIQYNTNSQWEDYISDCSSFYEEFSQTVFRSFFMDRCIHSTGIVKHKTNTLLEIIPYYTNLVNHLLIKLSFKAELLQNYEYKASFDNSIEFTGIIRSYSIDLVTDSLIINIDALPPTTSINEHNFVSLPHFISLFHSRSFLSADNSFECIWKNQKMIIRGTFSGFSLAQQQDFYLVDFVISRISPPSLWIPGLSICYKFLSHLFQFSEKP